MANLPLQVVLLLSPAEVFVNQRAPSEPVVMPVGANRELVLRYALSFPEVVMRPI